MAITAVSVFLPHACCLPFGHESIVGTSESMMCTLTGKLQNAEGVWIPLDDRFGYS